MTPGMNVSQVIHRSSQFKRLLELFPSLETDCLISSRIVSYKEGELIFRKGESVKHILFSVSGLSSPWAYGLREWILNQTHAQDYIAPFPVWFLSVSVDLIETSFRKNNEGSWYLKTVFSCSALENLDALFRSSGIPAGRLVRFFGETNGKGQSLQKGEVLSRNDQGALYWVDEGEVLLHPDASDSEYATPQFLGSGSWFVLDRFSCEALTAAVINSMPLPKDDFAELMMVLDSNSCLKRAIRAVPVVGSEVIEMVGESMEDERWSQIDQRSRQAKTLTEATVDALRVYGSLAGVVVDSEALAKGLSLKRARTPLVLAEVLESQGLYVKIWKAERAGPQNRCPFCILVNKRVVVVLECKASEWILYDGMSGLRRASLDEIGKIWNRTLIEVRSRAEGVPEGESTERKQFRVMRIIWELLSPYRSFFLTFLMLLGLVVGIETILPKVMQYLFDDILPLKEPGLVWGVVGLIFALGLFSIVSRTAQKFVINEFTNQSNFHLSSVFYHRYLAAHPNLFTGDRIGEVVARMSEMSGIRRFISTGAISLLVDVLMVVAGSVMLSTFGAEYLAIPAAIFVSLLFGNLIFKKGYVEESKLLFRDEVKLDSFLAEMVSSIQTIKANSVTREILDRWEGLLVSLGARGYRLQMRMNHFGLVTSLISGTGSVVGLYLAARGVLDGRLTPGELISINLYLKMVSSPVSSLSSMVLDWENVKLSLERVGQILLSPSEQSQDDVGSGIRISLRGEICFKCVSFQYRPEGPPVLRDMDFRVRPGEVVAIVGSSGSGKSTIANLIAGFYRVQKGAIELDGVNINSLNLSTVRSQVAYVNQDSKVFSGTISDNIAYGDDTPDMDRIRWAAGLANCDEFIHELPNQYEYRLGEGGLGLSGGQKQRLILARALYRRNRVIILDEATSSLDADSEGIVARNLKEVFHGSTAIIIAHRLSTVRNVDRILVVEGGHVIEEGDHDFLMSTRGKYFEMLNAGNDFESDRETRV